MKSDQLTHMSVGGKQVLRLSIDSGVSNTLGSSFLLSDTKFKIAARGARTLRRVVRAPLAFD
jgi:hypothetical protein